MSRTKNRNSGTKKVYELIIILLIIIVIVLCVIVVQQRDKNDFHLSNSPTPVPTDSRVTEGPDVTNDPTETSYVTPTPRVDELVEYTGRTEHVFFHSLLAFPELAFTQSNKEDLIKSTWFVDFVTVSEFNKIIEGLYNDGYMLINANDIYTEKTYNGVTKYEVTPFLFPKGKKPLIMSFDDTNYYSDKQGFGTVDKLILENDKVVTYTKMANGQEIISDDNEFIQVIDKFVEKHPDFSFNGAKGMIALTGFDGILGYRTHRNSPNRNSEIEAVKPIVKALKDTGWYFASHSYKHGAMTGYNVAQMRDCAQKFQNEVIPLIGETKLYVYPYGSWRVGDVQTVLKDEFGFTYFASVGANWYVKTRDDMKNVLFQDRANFDGFTLMHNGPLMVKYNDWGTDRFPSFNVDEIFNEKERKISRKEAQEIHSRLFNVSPRG